MPIGELTALDAAIRYGMYRERRTPRRDRAEACGAKGGGTEKPRSPWPQRSAPPTARPMVAPGCPIPPQISSG